MTIRENTTMKYLQIMAIIQRKTTKILNKVSNLSKFNLIYSISFISMPFNTFIPSFCRRKHQ